MAVLTVLYCAVISWRLSKPILECQTALAPTSVQVAEVPSARGGPTHRRKKSQDTVATCDNVIHIEHFVQHLCNAHPLRNQRTHRTQFVPRQFSGATGACGGLGSCPGGRAGGCGRPFANDCLRLTRLQTVQWNSVGRGDSSGDH